MTTFNFSWQHVGLAAGAATSLALFGPSLSDHSLSDPSAKAAQAATILLDFEGLQNLEPINNFYNGGTGGFGSTYSQNLGIAFSGNSLAIIDEDAGGTGNFGGEPSADTIAFFLTGDAAVMDVADGFDTGFSFFYAAVNRPGIVNVYDELGGVGNLLASIDLPLTPFEGSPDPTGQFSPLLPFGVNFDGIARSVDFGGTIDRIGFDNITLGSETPEIDPIPEPMNPTPDPIDPIDPENPNMPEIPTEPEPVNPVPIPPIIEPPEPERVPEPSSTAAILLSLAGAGGAIVRRDRHRVKTLQT